MELGRYRAEWRKKRVIEICFQRSIPIRLPFLFSAVIILGPNLVLITPLLLLLSNAKGWRRWFQWDFLEEEEGRVPPSPDRAKSIQLSMSSLCFHTSWSPAHNRFWVRRGENFKHDYLNFAYVLNLQIWSCLNAWKFKKMSWKRKKFFIKPYCFVFKTYSWHKFN